MDQHLELDETSTQQEVLENVAFYSITSQKVIKDTMNNLYCALMSDLNIISKAGFMWGQHITLHDLDSHYSSNRKLQYGLLVVRYDMITAKQTDLWKGKSRGDTFGCLL